MKSCGLTLCLFTFLLLCARTASGCSCASLGTPTTNLADANAVFLAKVVKAKKHEWRLLVTKIWKGAPDEVVVMRDPAAGASCEAEFTFGETYIFFARTKRSGTKIIYLPAGCTWTTSLSFQYDGFLVSGYVLRELGEDWRPPCVCHKKEPNS